MASSFLGNALVDPSYHAIKTNPLQRDEACGNRSKRGRKSSLPSLDLNKQIVLQQHHFNYSDEFAENLANFATAHLEDKNKEFKAAWKAWKDANAPMIEDEIVKMKESGYEGSVEDKMYFSARYYYRKKAIKEKTEASNEEGICQRKKYECIDKNVLIQMNEHILSQIESSTHDSKEGKVISNMTPSKSFADYCKRFSVCEDDLTVKKNYKNLYWRISKKVKDSSFHLQ